MPYFVDLSPYPGINEGINVAIGWLSLKHDFQKGQVSKEVIVRLQAFCKEPAYVTFGYHKCEFCNNVIGSGEIVVVGKDKLYFSPTLIVHYIQEHNYLPPEEFIEAVLNTEFIDQKPVVVLPEHKITPNPWSSLSKITVKQFVSLHKIPRIVEDERWYDELADKTLFYIDDEGKWGDEQCLLMTELLKDPKYDKP